MSGFSWLINGVALLFQGFTVKMCIVEGQLSMYSSCKLQYSFGSRRETRIGLLMRDAYADSVRGLPEPGALDERLTPDQSNAALQGGSAGRL